MSVLRSRAWGFLVLFVCNSWSCFCFKCLFLMLERWRESHACSRLWIGQLIWKGRFPLTVLEFLYWSCQYLLRDNSALNRFIPPPPSLPQAQSKSHHRKLTLEKEILLPLLPGLEPATFESYVRCSNHRAITAPDWRYLIHKSHAAVGLWRPGTVWDQGTWGGGAFPTEHHQICLIGRSHVFDWQVTCSCWVLRQRDPVRPRDFWGAYPLEWHQNVAWQVTCIWLTNHMHLIDKSHAFDWQVTCGW